MLIRATTSRNMVTEPITTGHTVSSRPASCSVASVPGAIKVASAMAAKRRRPKRGAGFASGSVSRRIEGCRAAAPHNR